MATINSIQNIPERYIIVLDFDIAKKYNFGYSRPMTREKAESVRELILSETGRKFPIIDFTQIGKEVR